MKNSVYFIILLFLLPMNACRKYQDGPAFTLVSKTERITRDWKLEFVLNEFVGGTFLNITAVNPEMRLRFRRDSLIVIYSPVTEKLYGNWEFAESKEVINWTLDHNPVTEMVTEVSSTGAETTITYDSLERFDIRRLTTDQLWLSDKFNNMLRFVPE